MPGSSASLFSPKSKLHEDIDLFYSIPYPSTSKSTGHVERTSSQSVKESNKTSRNKLYWDLHASTIYLFLDALLLPSIFHTIPFTCPIQASPLVSYVNILPKSFSIYLLFLLFRITFSILPTNSFCCFQLFQFHGFKPEEIRLIFCILQSHKSNFKFQNSSNISEMLITL